MEDGRTLSQGLKARLKDEIMQEISEEQKNKRRFNFKMKNPLERRMKLPYQKVKKGWCLVVVLRSNGSLDIQKLPIKNGMVYLPHNGTYHISTAEYIWRFGKYPVIFLPEWSVEPITPDLLVTKSNERSTNVDAEAFMIKAAEFSVIDKNKGQGFNGKIILYVLAAVAVGYVIMQFIVPKK